MNIADLWKHCRTLPGSTDQIQWGDDRVFKVGGKMYACTGTEKNSSFSFKVDEQRFLELTDQPGIVPAPYLARAKWVQVHPGECLLSKAELLELVSRSHAIVFAKLTKKLRREILDTDGTTK